ncbi:hypothetical protein THRCLA_22186 [Thraustotheca clavata]|uniref:Uncharacterized protein n=1 Tax=Thraustotheca clavata TaxID=74557 RepID=A0A1V9ZAQ4_9STRA|nr:hypothetical protein THRCLA_22186 [Thraustotheca clavata]
MDNVMDNSLNEASPWTYSRLQLTADMPPQAIADIITDLKQQRRAVDERRANVYGNLGMEDPYCTANPTKKRKAQDEIERPGSEFARLFVGNVVPEPMCS